MKYTSLKLSKLLADNGFEGGSGVYWGNTIGQKDQTCWRLYTKKQKEIPDTAMEFYPAYDVLNDLCLKYAKEMFAEEKIERKPDDEMLGRDDPDNFDNDGFELIKLYEDITEILLLLQQNKIDEAEEYIWKNCKFNPKNK